MSRKQAIEAEARELWRTLRAEPPPGDLAPSELLDVLIGLTPTPGYDRLHSPHLRDSLVSRPPARSSSH